MALGRAGFGERQHLKQASKSDCHRDTRKDIMSVAEENTVPPRAVVFDMDGILFDTEPIYFAAGDELLRRRGRAMTVELAQKMMGMPGPFAIEILRAEHGLEESAQDLLREELAIFVRLLDGNLRFMPGVLELLDGLAERGFPLAVATSTHRELTEKLIGSVGWRHRFQFLLTRDDVTRGKPHPDVYLLACDRLGHEPNDVVVIEDSLNGVRAAKAAGCQCVAVPHPLSRTLDFSIADLVADGLNDRRLHALVGL